MAARAAEVTGLPKLIFLVGQTKDAAGPVPSIADREAWDEYMRQGRAIIDMLVKEHGARYRAGTGGTNTLKLGGVQTSCTAGDWGLLSNWMNAALRKLGGTAELDGDAAREGGAA